MQEREIGRSLNRISHEIVERNPEGHPLAFIGIHTRGVPLAKRLRDLTARFDPQREIHAAGSLDVSFHRDDLARAMPLPKQTEIPFALDGARVILVDDVLFTGRTIRSALNALMDLGRPQSIQLAVLVDRGHRELPIRADYVGKNLPTARDEAVRVRVLEWDGSDAVELFAAKNGGAS
jgi:pyrimidine operon attenuation protein/uracil phosphoribosyltransferase